MVRDPRNLDQNPVVIDPAKVDAVLDDRPTTATDPLDPPDEEIEDEPVDEEDGKSGETGNSPPASRVIP